jgi:hypothetical protein
MLAALLLAMCVEFTPARSYYQHLELGTGRGESLRLVPLDMLARYPRLHPFYWSNFIQSGDWAALDGTRR